MKLEPWEPDLRTLLARVDEGELDLQPDFQRGLAWNASKQQRLIDTILRGWSVPPLHLLVLPEEQLAVLDGQQRLRAVVAFVSGQLRVGKWAPEDDSVWDLEGATYGDLPDVVKRRVQNYKLSCYRLYDYEPDEPYELFFRLNLPTGLTQAEKRNALVGDSRRQVKNLVELAEAVGWHSESVGFVNSRMAYDDTIARACAYVEANTLRVSLTPRELENQYRKKGGFSESTIDTLDRAIRLMADALTFDPFGPRLNKATLLTWLLAHCRAVRDYGASFELGPALSMIERGRAAVRRPGAEVIPPELGPRDVAAAYLDVYNDRASSRVTDVLSVVARDAVVWRLCAEVVPEVRERQAVADLLDQLKSAEAEVADLEWKLLQLLDDPRVWGGLS
ncbi:MULTISPECIES: DUF262 domain-containing protein [unclassified Modestobacter]|uniref:DUF262 domain-containing protein n=1 Tax=unclassified Modestobacter TaxID=2643866 RepID=UPI0022AA1022|nr:MULTISPECIES: DUF262 domain-containing protein [unclassified Modestobacter]MCZ2826613.1 DUF262 domain-containing protein [Modestobacter sp. VKM Ac-2981]MCZ2854993.1 DUF262 domain-containing protein [Modestobacter sp. VKM Ac-2982]